MTKRMKSPATAKAVAEHETSGNGDGKGTVTTAIHIPKATWELLREVAFHRAQVHGKRMSVSKLITQLVEDNRVALEKEKSS